jgi:hypothetical protein
LPAVHSRRGVTVTDGDAISRNFPYARAHL